MTVSQRYHKYHHSSYDSNTKIMIVVMTVSQISSQQL